MSFVSVIAAAVATFVFGAIWYGVLSGPWKATSQVPLDDDGNPINAKSPVPYVTSFICIILVAGMMRHSFATAGIDTIGKGLMSGLGVGLFFITPWIVLMNGYTARNHKLSVIDGGYATFGCAIIGACLMLF